MPKELLKLELANAQVAIALAGPEETNLKYLSQQTGTKLTLRGQELFIQGEAIDTHQCLEVIQSLAPYWEKAERIGEIELNQAIQAQKKAQASEYQKIQSEIISTTRHGEIIRAKTLHQNQYIKTIQTHDLTFGIGPAGTGKTFLAAVLAVKALLKDEYDRLILTRPAVEAGEKLGFLPGDLQQKVNPFLRPLYDALYEFIEPSKIPELMERGKIEVAPLAYMRGRTLSHAFIIVDEAQNTTPEQLKMVLTRLGDRSKMVVTGDITQIDLGKNQQSGLVVASKVLKSVTGIGFCRFSHTDVVRNPLVQKIVAAYEKYPQ